MQFRSIVQGAALLALALGACGQPGGEPAQARGITTEKPKGPPLSDADFARFVSWRDSQALPALFLASDGPAEHRPGGSRMGGPVWLPEGEGWPRDAKGRPLSFLAQIDFAELPPLEDYPTSGVLQFFIGRDDLYGADFEKPEAGTFRVIWREKLDGPGKLHLAKPQGRQGIDDYSPLRDETVLRGARLKGTLGKQKPGIDSWLFDRDLKDLLDRDPTDRIYNFFDEPDEAATDNHHIGGHPGFTQSDFRSANSYQDYDRVLLQLWTQDDKIMWGDSGQGQFLIRRADLLKKDFSKVVYQWDCY